MGANATTSVPVYASGEVLTAANLNITNSGIPVFATTVTRDAAFGGAGEKTLAEGQFAYIEATNTTQYYDGAAWQSLAAAREIASFTEYQANLTAGGTATSGSWIKRTLNTTLTNSITGCTLTASVISLPAGTYRIDAAGSFTSPLACKIKLRNTTDSTDTIFGANVYNSSTGPGAATAPLSGTFTIAATKNFEIQYRVAATVSSNGLGEAANFGATECYLFCTIEKVA
jgi:hypothetical protein